MFLPCGTSTYRLFSASTRVTATYNWPWEKQESFNCNTATFNVFPGELLIDMVKHILTGNCNLLKSNMMSLGIIGILGMNTSSPAIELVSIVSSIRYDIICLTTRLVPLHQLETSKFLRGIICVSFFSLSLLRNSLE